MLTGEQVDQASDLLFGLWRDGRRITAIPDGLRPTSRTEGYAIQARLEGRSAAPPFGWKIAATSRDGQAHIGVDGPLAGRLLAERVVADGATLPLGVNHMRVAELEFAFRMGQDLEPQTAPRSVGAVLDAVAALHPAIEVPDSRFDDYARVGAPQLIADNACAHQFLLGAAAPEGWRAIDLVAHRVTGSRNGAVVAEGSGANVLGDPRIALAWLANELSALGITLRAGQVVTTGTCVKPLAIAAGDTIAGDFGAIGTVTLRIAA